MIRISAELELIRRQVFAQIMRLQSEMQIGAKQKQTMVEKLKQMERALEAKLEYVTKIQDKNVRKHLLGEINSVRFLTNNVNSLLR